MSLFDTSGMISLYHHPKTFGPAAELPSEKEKHRFYWLPFSISKHIDEIGNFTRGKQFLRVIHSLCLCYNDYVESLKKI